MYNKIKYLKFILFVSLLIITDSLLFAQSVNYSDRLNIQIMSGTNITYSDYVSSKSGYNFTLGLEYWLPSKSKSNFGFTFASGYRNIKGENNNLGLPEQFSSSIIPFSLGVEYQHYFKKGILPFLNLGNSLYLFSFSDENIYSKLIDKTNGDVNNSFVIDANTGVKYLLNEKVTLKFQIGIHFILADNLDAIKIGNHNDFFTDINIGLSYNIWSKKDTDGDGLFDDEDTCPNEAEDFDGFQDEDGCPDLDNDNDGINDDIDLCVNIAEDIDGYKDNDGCPDLDNDGDNIPDEKDQCPNEAEDFDGFEDTDGCPDLDNDGDGILDIVDQCPNEAENINGYQDEDGCPDIFIETESAEELGNEIKVSKNYILHSEKTFDKNTLILKKTAYENLNEIVKVMKENPEYIWRIEGHVEKHESHAKSIKTSIAYADAVKKYLISKGVPSDNLQVTGLGDAAPIAANNTVFGRMKNRRISIIRLN